MDEMQEPPVVNKSNQDQIRQGETGHHLRYILIISCALVVVLFVAKRGSPQAVSPAELAGARGLRRLTGDLDGL